MIIPNAVGRIDEITDAIREGDREKAIRLTLAEHDRLMERYEAECGPLDKLARAIDDVTDFAKAIDPDRNETSDDSTWQQARLDCGWKGEE